MNPVSDQPRYPEALRIYSNTSGWSFVGNVDGWDCYWEASMERMWMVGPNTGLGLYTGHVPVFNKDERATKDAHPELIAFVKSFHALQQ